MVLRHSESRSGDNNLLDENTAGKQLRVILEKVGISLTDAGIPILTRVTNYFNVGRNCSVYSADADGKVQIVEGQIAGYYVDSDNLLTMIVESISGVRGIFCLNPDNYASEAKVDFQIILNPSSLSYVVDGKAVLAMQTLPTR